MKRRALVLFPFILLFSITVMAASPDAIVYVTRTGEKYHSDGCQYLRSSQREITLGEAIDRGYSPCSRCSPPRLDSSDSRPQYSPPSYNFSDNEKLAALQETIENLKEEKSDLKDEIGRLEDDLDDTKEIREENLELKNTLQDVKNYFQVTIAVGTAVSIFLFIQWYRARRAHKDTQEQLTSQLFAVTEQLKNTALQLTQAQTDANRVRIAYAQLKISEKSNIPIDIRFDDQGLPYTDPRNKRYPWGGNHTVFRSKHGTRIHKLYGCCNATIPVHRYIAIQQKMSRCSKCCDLSENFEIDDWYLEYNQLKESEQLILPLKSDITDT